MGQDIWDIIRMVIRNIIVHISKCYGYFIFPCELWAKTPDTSNVLDVKTT